MGTPAMNTISWLKGVGLWQPTHTLGMLHSYRIIHDHFFFPCKDGKLKKGDRIVSINEKDFRNLKREKALPILSQLKTKSVLRIDITPILRG